MIHIKAEVFAGASEEKVEKIAEDKLKVWVREEPRNNFANRRILELVAQTYGLETGKVRIIKGHKSPRKILEINR